MLTPCFAVFFKETTTARNVNYFYKRNILLTNGIFAVLFAVLIAHLNIDPYQGFDVKLVGNMTLLSASNKTGETNSTLLELDQFKDDSFNYVRRNVLFSCKDKKHAWTNHEFSLPLDFKVR